MAQTLLVGPEIESGKRILEALDKAEFRIRVALWAVLAEYGDWRLVLASNRFHVMDIREAYFTLHEVLDEAGFSFRETSSLMIVSMKDKFIRELRRTFGKAANVEGMRLGGQTFGDRHLEDAYVYRIS